MLAEPVPTWVMEKVVAEKQGLLSIAGDRQLDQAENYWLRDAVTYRALGGLDRAIYQI
jgi:hypothetical protein